MGGGETGNKGGGWGQCSGAELRGSFQNVSLSHRQLGIPLTWKMRAGPEQVALP